MSDKKSTEAPEREVKRVTIAGAKCGMCIGFTRQALKGEVCKTLGEKSYSKPCSLFTVDPYTFTFHPDVDPDKVNVKGLVKFVKGLKTRDHARLAALLVQDRTTRRFGFELDQIVYVQLYPGDYLSNWAKARVIHATKEYVYVQGKDLTFRAMMYHASVKSKDEFEPILKRLQEEGRTNDPDLKKYTAYRPLRTKMIKSTYRDEIPTIDRYGSVSAKMGKATKPGVSSPDEAEPAKPKTGLERRRAALAAKGKKNLVFKAR